jgi:amidophosphoribosyltransferase
MPTRTEFVACDLTEEEIRSVLGADGLLYQDLEDMLGVAKEMNPSITSFEDSCFSGPTLPPQPPLPLGGCTRF